MSGLELLSRHRVGGSVILVIQQPSAHQPERLSSEWRRLRIWKSKKQRNHRDHRIVVMEVVDGPHDAAPRPCG
jgi:hypothetical protein